MRNRSSGKDRRFQITPKAVRQFRRMMGWSAKRLSEELGFGLQGYTRSYVKSIEGGSLPLTEKFVARFRLLRNREIGNLVGSREIVSRYYIPKRLIIVARPRKCPACRSWFVPRTPNQKYSSRECASAARRSR